MQSGHFLSWIEGASSEQRIEAARSLARAFGEFTASEEELETAEAAATLLADDPDPDVRLALAEAFAPEPLAPRHVVMSLAGDLPEIAALVLACSPVFVDAELADFLDGAAPQARVAIACRAKVSAPLAAKIASCCEDEACRALLANPGAELEPSALHAIAERFGIDSAIRRQLVERADLAPRTRLLLIEKLAQSVEVRLACGNVGQERVGALSRETCEKAIIAYAASVNEGGLREIVETLVAGERLTTVFLLRTVCMGNIALFAEALSTLAQVPLVRVEAVLRSGRAGVLRALYRRADMPEMAFDVFARAVATWRGLLGSAEPVDAARMSYLVTRDILACYRGNGEAGADPLLVLLRKLAAEAARENARREVARLAEAIAEPEVETELVAGDETVGVALPEAIELPAEVVAAFAAFFAEEIVELEEELAGPQQFEVVAAGMEPIEENDAALAADFEAMADAIANDDAPAPFSLDVRSEPNWSVLMRMRAQMREKAA